MKTLKIACFNTWNSPHNKTKLEDKTLVVSNLIKKEDFDIVGFQELTYGYTNSLKEKLTNYCFTGSYRFSFMKKSFIYNENNNILTKERVLISKTIKLPFIPRTVKGLIKSFSFNKWALIPRIMTLSLINYNNTKILIINTHLDYKLKEIKIRQLEFIKIKIAKYIKKYSVILMGDFNIELDNEYFKKFVNDLEEIGLTRVNINKNTYGNNKKGNVLDNIFVPNSWKIVNSGIFNRGRITKISDHKMIFVECEIK